MKFFIDLTTACMLAAVLALSSCAGLRKAGSGSVAMVRNSSSAATAKMSSLAKSTNASLGQLLPGPKVQVVTVREKELQKLPTGHERALAFESERKQRFWFFGGPVDFKEPSLPQPGTDLDGSLLPPRMP